MFKLMLVVSLLFGTGMTNIQNESTNELDMFYMYSNDEGYYFLEPSSEFENVIFVRHEDLKKWGIGDNLHHGQKFIGIFDETGWELQGIK